MGAAWCWLGVCCAAAADGPEPPCRIRLTDVTAASQIAFTHTDGSTGQYYMIEPMSAGVALFDYDRDGDADIYFLNGTPLEKPETAARPRNALYRNDGAMRFTDVTDRAGVGDTGFGLGVAVGDYDGDGWLDLYVNNHGPNVLYRNRGDGTFADVTRQAGVAAGHRAGAGANFLDADADGDLDLFVANYVDFSCDANVVRTVRGRRIYPGPRDYATTANVLFRNDGGGRFTDVSAASGISAHTGSGMGTVCVDYDADGDTDIVVANDDWGNFLLQNDGTGKFTEEGLIAGIAYDLDGDAQSSMGVACGDYDNDGRLDLHMTSYHRELATLYRDLGDGFFEDVTRLTRAGAGTFAHVTWGNAFADLDADGDRDLFVACGHLQHDIDEIYDFTSYRVRNVVLMNDGKGQFVDVSDRCGEGLAARFSSRGAALDDLDNDGDVDAVVLNARQKPTILRNDSPQGNHWIRIRLRGMKTNRDGVGARVTVVTGDLTQVEEVHSGQGYQSHFGMVPHFGLGQRDRIDRIEVRWIGGGVDVVENVPVDRSVTIVEGGRLVGN